MKFICQKCKGTVSDSVNFCNHCGSEFKTLNDTVDVTTKLRKFDKAFDVVLNKVITEHAKGINVPLRFYNSQFTNKRY